MVRVTEVAMPKLAVTERSGQGCRVAMRLLQLAPEDGQPEGKRAVVKELPIGDDCCDGLCAECGEPIARPRLQAIPYTQHCIDCARQVENGG